MDADDRHFRAYIECDACGSRNPSKKCSSCKCAFYCSVECQRQDWTKRHKKECIPVETRYVPLPQISDSLVTPLNSECGICLEEPIKHPVVLPACRHAFCFSCLSSWQGDWRDSPTNMMWRMMGQTEKITKHCPFCRVKIEKHVAQLSERACGASHSTPAKQGRYGTNEAFAHGIGRM
jgi:MYND finger/RING-type zinc-finger